MEASSSVAISTHALQTEIMGKSVPEKKIGPGRKPGPQPGPTKYILGEVLRLGSLKERDLPGPASPVEKASLSTNVDGLLEQGWLSAPAWKHKSDRDLSLGPQAGHVIGVSVARDVLRCAIYTPRGSTEAHVAKRAAIFPEPFDYQSEREAISPEALRDLIAQALTECREKLRRPVYPVGCAVAWQTRISSHTEEPEPL